MNVCDKKIYDTLSVDDRIPFHTHYDVCDKCFGMHIGNTRAKMLINDSCCVWMPKHIKDGKRAASGSLNQLLSADMLKTKEITPRITDNPGYIRLIFGMDGGTGDYYFRGAFMEDRSRSDAYTRYFDRVATKVRLIGNPVTDIELLDDIRAVTGPAINLEEEGIKQETEIEKLSLEGKDKEAVIKVRANQGIFREQLLKRYSHCCLCGVKNQSLLVASHIKPWAESESTEKLDPDNGFLMCPNHDKLFDQGLISFDDEGRIIISDKVDESDRLFMNIRLEMKIKCNLTDGNRKYLNYHREHVFQK